MNEEGLILWFHIVAEAELILQAAVITAFCHPFTADGRVNKKKRGGRSGFLFLLYAGVNSAVLLPFVQGWMCALIFVFLFTLFSGFWGMDKSMAFYLNVLFHGLKYLSTLAVESVNYFSSGFFQRNASALEKIFLRAVENYLLVTILRLALLAAMLYGVRYALKKTKAALRISELCYLLLMPVTGILFVRIIFRLLIVADDTLTFQLYEQFPAFVGMVPVVAALIYAGILITTVSYQKLTAFHEIRERHLMEEQQMRAMQERMEEAEQRYDGIRRMKHEMRGHLTNIKGLAESGCYGDIEEYIAKMDESMAVLELTVKTGNAVLDVIISDKQKTAHRQGIRFVSEFVYPESKGYHPYDVGIIVGNLLQNALEACSRMTAGERYIILRGIQKKKFFLIEVQNSFEGEIEMDGEEKLPRSAKKDAMHGIGLSNVKREVEKYMGDMDIKVTEGKFCVVVMLQEA